MTGTATLFPVCARIAGDWTTILKSFGNPCSARHSRGVRRSSPIHQQVIVRSVVPEGTRKWVYADRAALVLVPYGRIEARDTLLSQSLESFRLNSLTRDEFRINSFLGFENLGERRHGGMGIGERKLQVRTEANDKSSLSLLRHPIMKRVEDRRMRVVT